MLCPEQEFSFAFGPVWSYVLLYKLLAHYINVLLLKHEKFGVVVGKIKDMGFNLENVNRLKL